VPKKKSKLNKEQRRTERLRKASQWASSYAGSHIIRDYRKRFKVDPACAISDMEVIGALPKENLEALQRGEEARLRHLADRREQKQHEQLMERYPDSSDEFYYIAGYTSGGAPYGLTWEEMGLKPYEMPDGTD
jgi:hypothetical protein